MHPECTDTRQAIREGYEARGAPHPQKLYTARVNVSGVATRTVTDPERRRKNPNLAERNWDAEPRQDRHPRQFGTPAARVREAPPLRNPPTFRDIRCDFPRKFHLGYWLE